MKTALVKPCHHHVVIIKIGPAGSDLERYQPQGEIVAENHFCIAVLHIAEKQGCRCAAGGFDTGRVDHNRSAQFEIDTPGRCVGNIGGNRPEGRRITVDGERKGECLIEYDPAASYTPFVHIHQKLIEGYIHSGTPDACLLAPIHVQALKVQPCTADHKAENGLVGGEVPGKGTLEAEIQFGEAAGHQVNTKGAAYLILSRQPQ